MSGINKLKQPPNRRVTIEIESAVNIKTKSANGKASEKLYQVKSVKRGFLHLESMDGDVLEIKVLY